LLSARLTTERILKEFKSSQVENRKLEHAAAQS
jgi:hypothetical protein